LEMGGSSSSTKFQVNPGGVNDGLGVTDKELVSNRESGTFVVLSLPKQYNIRIIVNT
jgi:hypothetical protein